MEKYVFLFGSFLAVLSFSASSSVGSNNYHTIPQDSHEYQPKKQVPILKQNFEQHDEGYKHSFEAGNGIYVQEQGYFKNKGDKKHETLVQQGTITYLDEHGNPITLSYIADENGFQPQGAHLPTPPPIPVEIAKALEQNQHLHYQQEESGNHYPHGLHYE